MQKTKSNAPFTQLDFIKIINRLKRERKKIIIIFFEQYLNLIEKIIVQLNHDAIDLDNFSLLQIRLVSFLSLWLNEFEEKQKIFLKMMQIIY